MNKLSILLLIILFLGIISCENSLDPLDKETGLYSVYGALDLRAETNYIRIRDLNTPFVKAQTESINGTVTLQNEQEESSTILESELVEYFDLYHHNFEYDERVIPDTPYQLMVESSEGKSVSLSVRSPTMPVPSTAPVNQKCNVPVNFQIGPLNGSTIAIDLGYRSSTPINGDYWRWGPKYVFGPNEYQSSEGITFTFSPFDELREILPYVSPIGICKEYWKTGNIILRYQHYGPGFYEELTKDTLDIVDTHRFGAFYYDTLAIPYDTLQTCGPECLTEIKQKEEDE